MVDIRKGTTHYHSVSYYLSGANTGIGKETAQDLVTRGARVIILCRSLQRGDGAAKDILQKTGKTVEVEKLDLSSLKSVRECAGLLLQKLDRIDILINNAGVMYTGHVKTEDGLDMQLGTNHFGHFLLTELLMPLVKKSAGTGFRPRFVSQAPL